MYPTSKLDKTSTWVQTTSSQLKSSQGHRQPDPEDLPDKEEDQVCEEHLEVSEEEEEHLEVTSEADKEEAASEVAREEVILEEVRDEEGQHSIADDDRLIVDCLWINSKRYSYVFLPWSEY